MNITSGGTYVGQIFQSNLWSEPAVTVSTQNPVTFYKCVFVSQGTCIEAPWAANLTIQNCYGICRDPMVPGQRRGSFLHAIRPSSVSVEQCEISGAYWAIFVDFQSNFCSNNPILIWANRILDIEGRPSDGNGGVQSTMVNGVDDNGYAHAVVLMNGWWNPLIRIWWNEIRNREGLSAPSDLINLYGVSGTPGSPVSIQNNYLEGVWPADRSATTCDGSGIVTDFNTPLQSQGCQYILIDSNQCVHCADGVALWAGSNLKATGNRIVNSGLALDGTPYSYTWAGGLSLFNTQSFSSTNEADSNSAACVIPSVMSRADFQIDSSLSAKSTNQLTLYSGQTITRLNEAQEYALWIEKVRTGGVQIGPHSW